MIKALRKHGLMAACACAFALAPPSLALAQGAPDATASEAAQANAGQGAATDASDVSYPTCSAKVTDHCMQRGGREHAAQHAKAAHKAPKRKG